MGQLLSSSMPQIRTGANLASLDLTSPLYSILKQPFCADSEGTNVIALLSKPQQPSDRTCATPPVCPLWRAVISKPFFFACCLGSHPRQAPSLCEFQTPVNNSQSETLIASLQLQKVTGLQSDLPLFPPCRHRPKPRVGSRGSSPVTAASRCKERVNRRASGRGQGFCTRLQQRSLAGAFPPCITLTFLARQSHSTRPAPICAA